MTAFIGVYKAIYDYEPQTAEELAIQEGDLLYLLEKSDVDDWWTVKKRVLGSDEEEPVGLVPSNYVECAPIISRVKAVYGYEQVQNPEEELTFHENELFDVYDDKDIDWLLVQSQSSKQFGFIPGNYVEPENASGDTAAAANNGLPGDAPLMAPVATSQMPAAIVSPVVTPANVASLLPPPQHPNRTPLQTSESTPIAAEPEAPPMPARNSRPLDDDEDVAPPKPSRPQSTGAESNRERSRSRVSYQDVRQDDNTNEDNYYTNNNNNDYNYHDDRSDYRTWNIAEIDGRKKRKCKLSIGTNKIFFQPQKGEPQEWTIDKLTSYDNEKKHMFLEFVDPYKSLELHTGSNDTCNEIMSVIAEFKGASRDPGLKEVELASKSKKQGNVLYDFLAESQDELTVKQGQTVYILNDKKSRDWWMCELVGTGKRGVVPAQFVEPVKSKSESSGGILNSFKKFTKGSGKSSNSKSSSNNWKDDEEQDVSADRKSKGKSRSNSTSSKKKRSASMSNKSEFPDPKKSRIWADRSGTFKVEAQFIGCSDGKIHLHKSNGVKIAVAADKLSDDDLIYVERATGFSLDKYKPKRHESKDPRDSERERRKRLKEQDEKERDRKLREKELDELRMARTLLDEERAKLQERELPPIKPPRPQSTGSAPMSAAVTGGPSLTSTTTTQPKKNDYDWFEFFLNCGVDVSNCQRYTLNFEREQVTEDMMSDINSSMLRTLGLKEGDIVRVMKYLDNKFGRDSQVQSQYTSRGGMFSEPDGSLKIATTNGTTGAIPAVASQLLPQKQALTANVTTLDDDAWTVKPAAKLETNPTSNKSEFTGSMQDLLDLQPLEPKKKPIETVPQPNLEDLEPVRSSNPISAVPTGGTTLAPLDPFKTGGHNLLPMTTGFVMMPIATGGLMPIQRTGGLMLPQTTFGMQATGTALQPQRTAGGSIPMMITGGFMPQTSFQTQPISMPPQRTGGTLAMSVTGGALNVPPLGSVLPLQKTATGLMPANLTGGVLPMQRTAGTMPLQMTGGLVPFQRTGGTVPMQTTGGLYPLQATGGLAQMNMTGGNLPPQGAFSQQITGGINMIPQTSFSTQITGGANLIPQTSFGANITGGVNMMPRTSFANNITGGANMMPQTSFASNVTGGANMMPQTSFGNTQSTGGLMQFGATPNYSQTQSFPNMTGGPQPNAQFGLQTAGQPMQPFNAQPMQQFTGQPMQQFTGQPMQQFQNNLNTGVNGITQGMQNISMPQQQPALQTQPTGFGFGNGPQLQQQQQARPANLYNATADNPFGF